MDDAGERLGDDIARFVRDPQADALDAALLVGRALTAEFDSARCREVVDALADRRPEGSEPWTYLADLGFAGSRDDYDAVRGSRLDWVMDNHQGIPISLGVLLIHVAKQAGRAAVGVNFPGHFLVRVDSQLVDPLAMTCISEDECLTQFGQGARAAPGQVLFQEAPPGAILLRMLNNVKYQYAAAAQWDRALDMVGWQLRAQPDSAQLFMERGELWSRLGSVSAARDAYARVLQHTDDSQFRAMAQSRLANLGADEPIH